MQNFQDIVWRRITAVHVDVMHLGVLLSLIVVPTFNVYAQDNLAELTRDLVDENSFVRYQAVDSLGVIGESAIPALIEALGDEYFDVRNSAASTLGVIGESAIPALIEALGDEYSPVRSSAADALGAIGEGASAAIPALIEALGDEDFYVRSSAASTLGVIGEPIVRNLIQELGLRSNEVGGACPEGMACHFDSFAGLGIEELANFPLFYPWPPPEPSTRKVNLPQEDFFQGAETLGDVSAMLLKSLEEAGYTDRTYYRVPDGFALVTKLEQIDEEANPKPGAARWAPEVKQKWWNPATFLRILSTLNLPPGYFRVLVFVVTTEEGFMTEGEISRSEAVAWLDGDWNKLPRVVAEQPFTTDYDVEVLVYEFELPSSGEAVLTHPSHHQGQEHLERANDLYLHLQGQ